MKALVLLWITAVSAIFSQNINITFRVIAENVDRSESVYIAGNTNELGNWAPDKVKLNKSDDSLWEITLSFEQNSILEFKFTKGSWNKEALTEKGEIPQNHVFHATNDTTLTFHIRRWRDQGISTPSFKGKITGEVKYHKQIEYEGLLPRDVVVWLPPGYYKEKTKRYPVLYMHDGQNLFDPSTSSFGVDWQADEAADSLIRKGIIKPIIIVGIYNTSDRNYDYTPGEKGSLYMKFLVNKLKPFIDKTYRTLPDKENTAIAGSSLGGLISFMLGWEYPEVFSKAGCFSPAFKIENIDYVSNVKSSQRKRDVFFYIDNGGIGLEERLQPGITEMLNILKSKGYKANKDLVWIKDKNARHSEGDWAKRFPYMLKLFFGK